MWFWGAGWCIIIRISSKVLQSPICTKGKRYIWECKQYCFLKKSHKDQYNAASAFTRVLLIHSLFQLWWFSYKNNSTSTTYHTNNSLLASLVFSFLSFFLTSIAVSSVISVAFQDMCPLRFILVFFSAALAAYFAWTTVRSSPEIDLTTQDQNNKASSNKDNFSFNKVPSVPVIL